MNDHETSFEGGEAHELALAFNETPSVDTSINKDIYSGPWAPNKSVDYAAEQKPVPSAAIPINTSKAQVNLPPKAITHLDEDDHLVTSATIYKRTAQFKIDPNSFDMCDSIGSALLKARELLGLSIEEVEIASRIRASFLIALERNDYTKLPQTVYIIAYIKSLFSLYRISKADQDKLMEKLKTVEGFETLSGNETPFGELVHTPQAEQAKRIKLTSSEYKQQIKGVIIVLLITLTICAIVGGSVFLIFKLIDANNATVSLSQQPLRNEKKTFSETDIRAMYSTIPIIKMNEISSE